MHLICMTCNGRVSAQPEAEIIRERKANEFDDWLTQAEDSKITQLVNFAAGVRKDYDAVKNACTLGEITLTHGIFLKVRKSYSNSLLFIGCAFGEGYRAEAPDFTP